MLPRESRGFHLAFQLALLEARDAIDEMVALSVPSSPEAEQLIRVAFLNYMAGSLLMPYATFLAAATSLRHDMDAMSARFGVSFDQACNRLASLQRPGTRGVPFFFCASTRPATSRNASPPRVFHSPASAAPARAG